MLLLFMIMGVILFASGAYYCENLTNKDDFPSIPHSFWWAVVTMTTVGYGDISPKTFQGKNYTRSRKMNQYESYHLFHWLAQKVPLYFILSGTVS